MPLVRVTSGDCIIQVRFNCSHANVPKGSASISHTQTHRHTDAHNISCIYNTTIRHIHVHTHTSMHFMPHLSHSCHVLPLLMPFSVSSELQRRKLVLRGEEHQGHRDLCESWCGGWQAHHLLEDACRTCSNLKYSSMSFVFMSESEWGRE